MGAEERAPVDQRRLGRGLDMTSPKEGTDTRDIPSAKSGRPQGEGEGASAPWEAESRPEPQPSPANWPRWEGRKIPSLMPLVFDKKTLVAVLGEVRRNHGVPGVDGESVEEFSE